jgi:hypothetical protein
MAAKHPAANLLRFLLVQDPQITDAQLQKQLDDWGFLSADMNYLGFLRQSIPAQPTPFFPQNRAHRESVRYLRNLEIYEMFNPNEAMNEAWEVLSNPEQRLVVEQILLARLDLKIAATKVNEKRDWHLTSDGLSCYRHYFWNVPSLTFDEWGRYMFSRTSLYERYMALLTAPPKLAFYHLRLDQSIDSKRMIQDAQMIAHKTLLEIDERPGSTIEKVKSINLLSKVIIEAHAALSTSDMALKDVLKQFEHWRMDHPQLLPPSIKTLAPVGNFSGSGLDADGEPKAKA